MGKHQQACLFISIFLLVLGAMTTSSAARDISTFNDHGRQGSGGSASFGQGEEKFDLFPRIPGSDIPPLKLGGSVHGGVGAVIPGIGVDGDLCLGCSENGSKGFIINNSGQSLYCLPLYCPAGICDAHQIGLQINQFASSWPNPETDHESGAGGVQSSSAMAPESISL